MSPISLILTVLNEADSLPALLDTLAGQSLRPDEVIVCDGGSRDRTVALLRAERRLAIRVIESPGANISRGRNLAIGAAAEGIVACTDAGVRLEPDWLERITAPLRESETAMVSAGFFKSDPRTTFEVAMGATVLPELGEIDPATFLPSSRSVAFRKSAWAAVGGYPEWLDYCEDLIFDLNLRKQFGAFAFAPRAVAHFRPRGSVRSFYKQYYLYARGDGKAGLFLKRHLIRYATYLLAAPAALAGLIALPGPAKLVCALALLTGAAFYLRAPYQRLFAQWTALPLSEKLRAALWVPAIRVIGDLAKMLGYPAGLAWRRGRGRGEDFGQDLRQD
jgi:glycosyltransferase involved in cell wall biosynthesis